MTRRNVVVVCLDSVRKDFADEYAPRLGELADASFEQCRAASSWSTPSHASMLTGTLPHQHGVHTYDRSFDSVPPVETFLADLEEHTTIGVSANRFASSEFGFDRYFNRFREVTPQCRYPDGLNLLEYANEIDGSGVKKYLAALRAILGHDHPLASLRNAVLLKAHDGSKNLPIPKMLDDSGAAVLRTARREIERAGEPYFAFLNLMDAHGPLQHSTALDGSLHDAPNTWSSNDREVWELMGSREEYEQYWEHREAVYGATVDYLDRIVASFVEDIERRSSHDLTVIITADHGENHAEEENDGLASHKSSLSEALLHVPCFLVGAPPEYDCESDGYFSHLDLDDLVRHAAGEADRPDLFRERVPAELVGMSAGADPPSGVDADYFERMIRCVYDEGRKIEWDSIGNRTEYRLYPDRPGYQEVVGEPDDLPGWATDFFGTPIEEYVETARARTSTHEVSETTKQQLENLGYR